ncbi:hypothetical protein AMJ39_05685 [candidate division TA06 bacterium DG_24]|jgi:hypothetical protein|uniref:Nucleotidyl transferase AbiEii/AbiGii toxin family protein n=3 Tax=Bacteria division TA06 TaxID=1156500 RepID=A0A0S8JK31_UNCT6|nr:MAG: hypothetical protein AMJ39_05685 [candidate division TA06 bacterium DG_24]KPK69271.1 MAG: hypothetical protein AMJ82_06035 [candidate division TA06 bacterium SM23_40]KPL09746.1 MAG: hypothetical protein AMJ71_05605 [candidate division TA06 bacterium SM1_40]
MPVQSDYTMDEVGACRSVILEIASCLGAYRDHMVLVGGWAPYFLLQRHRETNHCGSLDVDIALDSNAIPADAYQSILSTLQERGFEPRRDVKGNVIPSSFLRTFTGTEGREHVVQVDFLAPEYGGTGKNRRHQRVQDLLARKCRGSDLVFDMNQAITLRDRLPNGAWNEAEIKVADVGAVLAMKGFAFFDRSSEKDAYDIYMLCREYGTGPDDVAEAVIPRSSNRLIREGLSKISDKFSAHDAVGPVAVADFLEEIDREERERIARDAYEVIDYVLKRIYPEA